MSRDYSEISGSLFVCWGWAFYLVLFNQHTVMVLVAYVCLHMRKQPALNLVLARLLFRGGQLPKRDDAGLLG